MRDPYVQKQDFGLGFGKDIRACGSLYPAVVQVSALFPRRAPQAEPWGLWLSRVAELDLGPWGVCDCAYSCVGGGSPEAPDLRQRCEVSWALLHWDPLVRPPLWSDSLCWSTVAWLDCGTCWQPSPGLRGLHTQGVPPPWAQCPSSGQWGFSGAPGWGQGWTFLPCLKPGPTTWHFMALPGQLTLY